MTYTRFILIAALLLNLACQPPSLKAQTYVGEILYRNSYQYIKLQIKDGKASFSVPYIDDLKKYPVKGNWQGTQPWSATRGLEIWKFETNLTNDHITGTLTLATGSQPVLLHRQLPKLAVNTLSKYAGVYADAQNRRVVIYHNNDYLHLMSPYSEESVSLKPTAPQSFWSVSGEKTQFSNLKSQQYQQLQVTTRMGEKHTLKRSFAIKMEEVWIPVGKDTLYGQLYLPQVKTKVPGCVALQGGGTAGLANYVYDARFLAAYGMATLIFNKSGEGKSKGDGHYRRMTFEEKNTQYCKVFKYLQSRPEVNPKKVGIHGPSEGGRLGLMMAIDMPDQVAFVDAVSAPVKSMRHVQLYAIDHHIRNLGVSESVTLKTKQIWNRYFDEIIAGKISEQTIKDANSLRALHNRMFLPPNSTRLPLTPNAADIDNDRVVKEADKIKCPVLFQYGENDQIVHPYKSLQNFRKYVNPKTPIQVIIYPRASHSFMTPEFRISIGYNEDKVKWLKQIGIL